MKMVRQRLRSLGPSVAAKLVKQFGFFFPSENSQGDRIVFTPEQLAEGDGILQRLVQIAGSGAFLPTNNHKDDCTYCEYAGICGDVESVAAASQRKLDNPANTTLQPFLELRTHVQARG
jgi:hypothetical protein